jgi:hypothetical protein
MLAHSLEPFFHRAVRSSFAGKLGFNDSDVIGYVARLLSDFAATDKLFSLRDSTGHPIENLEAMIFASDPVLGDAPSFDAERSMRKHIGDYALFLAGMYPEPVGSSGRHLHRPSLSELVRVGKQSYFIVSQFNLFEYEKESPLFARLSDSFERCVLGLSLMRDEISSRKTLALPHR